MTVSYSSTIATVRYDAFLHLLFRWKGSVYKAVWPSILFFCLAYTAFSVSYYAIPSDTIENKLIKRKFVLVCVLAGKISNAIPVSFVLGFFVNLLVKRWWNQFLNLPTPDSVCLLLVAYLNEPPKSKVAKDGAPAEERPQVFRRTVTRYLNLSYALLFSAISPCMKQRIGSLDELVNTGLMTKQEQLIYISLDQDRGHFFIPVVWAITLLTRAHYEGMISNERRLDTLITEVIAYWNRLYTISLYGYMNVPLVYNQVVILAVYLYLAVLVLSQQFSDPMGMLAGLDKEMNATAGFTGTSSLDVLPNIPVLAVLTLVCYIGWLVVGIAHICPFGADDDDFDVIPLLERNMAMGMWCVDTALTSKDQLPASLLTPDADQASTLLQVPRGHETMGLKRRLPSSPAESSASLQTEMHDLPYPEELKRRVSKQFYVGSAARLCEEQAQHKEGTADSLHGSVTALPSNRNECRRHTELGYQSACDSPIPVRRSSLSRFSRAISHHFSFIHNRNWESMTQLPEAYALYSGSSLSTPSQPCPDPNFTSL